MSYLFAIAVLGGAASVLTPCVLPLLPAILAVSGGAGRWRVLGIAAGIELSFFLIAILLAGAITSLGLPQNVLQWVAAALLAAFGLVLVVPRLEGAWSAALSRLTSRVRQPAAAGGGFAAGFVTGLPLGLVWTPCAGPILAGITVAASTSRFETGTLYTMSGYALGMAGPLLGVIFGGHKLSVRLRRALGGGRRVLVPMGLVLIATAVLIALGGFTRLNRVIAERINLTSTPTASLERRALARGPERPSADEIDLTRSELESNGYPELGRLADLGPAPEIVGISRWYNTGGRALSLESLRGKVVLVDFWTYSCINCIRTLPHIKALDERYRADGLVVIGVHTPEFEFEKDPGNVGRAVRDFGIRYPVALDPDYRTWDNYHNRYWPAHYLVDRSGSIRSVHYGEGEYARTEDEVRRLLGMEPGSVAGDDDIQAITPETYLGSARAARFAGEPNELPDGPSQYTSPPDGDGGVRLAPDTWSYAGSWTLRAERAEAGRGAQIYLRYRAQDVFIVAGPPREGSGSIRVTGGPNVTVDAERLYTLRSGRFTDDVLQLDVSAGVQVYAFTFG